jgi:transposase
MEEITEEAGMVARVAALDIGKASLVACVRVPLETVPGRRRQEVRTFATTTRALLELRDWLVCQGVTRCVMEATSTYWKPPFYLLETTSPNAGWSTPATSRTSPAGRRPTR